jgi:hypothetical protein
MRRVFDGFNRDTCRVGVLQDVSGKQYRLAFSNALDDLCCYRQAVGFGMQLRGMTESQHTGETEMNFRVPAYVNSMSFVACCQELDGLGFTFTVQGLMS